MNKDLVVKDRLENWDYGTAIGYYEQKTKIIHILDGKDVEILAQIHENTHLERSNKLSFKFASMNQIPQVRNLLFSFIVLFAFLTPFTTLFPFLFVAAVFLFLEACFRFEEYKAEQAVKLACKRCKNHLRGEKQ